jgi:purine-binding chemotaxis protein CheW
MMAQGNKESPPSAAAVTGDGSPRSEPVTGSELLVFRAGPERFALAVGELEAVIEMPAVRPLPGMPAGMLGVAELRGSLVPVYSPARVLNIEVREVGAAIIVQAGARAPGGSGRRIAIAVSRAEGVTAYEPSEWGGVGGAVPHAGLVRGVATWDGHLVTLVDATTFVASCIDSSGTEPA